MSLPDIPPDLPVLIAGPTASGKSALAMEVARRHGGVIVNADASQIYDCWRVVTARPSEADEAAVPHKLYGHVPWNAAYSAGHWLREVTPLLNGPERPIIVGGTGLYFMALTEGLVDIPATSPEVRAHADALPDETLLEALDTATRARIDTANRARVQRAWEVLESTRRGLAAWQDDTPPPLLPLTGTVPLVVEAPKDWLEARIFQRFDQMVADGALDEVAAMAKHYDPARPAFKAIGVPELMAHYQGDLNIDDARTAASVATRQFAKRQRTWIRKRMRTWQKVDPTRL